MPTVAYLANLFPSSVEPYVAEEIQELRRRGVTVISCSARHHTTALDSELKSFAAETLYLQPLRLKLLIHAAFMCLLKFPMLKDFLRRALLQESEPIRRRLRALLHTWLGVYYALLIERSGVEHIHVHHGYFASWIAMVAARFLGIEFSMTLHGSDLLLHPASLDTKLKHCKFCVTVSEFNRRHILERYPEIQPEKIIVRRMGVDPGTNNLSALQPSRENPRLVMLAVGRLHPVKDHIFLVRACRLLKNRDVPFVCLIAGEGPERVSIDALIRDLDLRGEVRLVGHLSRQQLDACYASADLVVLTSRSEGIPLVLMEAMAHGKPVLAPAITGIPELVSDGKNGFLYRQGSPEDFVARVELVHDSAAALGPLGRAARQHVLQHFNREKNLAAFCNLLLTHISRTVEHHSYENPILQ
ncbi:MAG TPA: glycosyltransferase family 4 protein [Terriglobales bacterium]|nr:glycosyltransferase family 4 protein [Terriglobales bacterium]